MKKIILVFLFLYSDVCLGQTFYKKFPTALDLDYDVAAVEIGNGYILGDNEVDASSNFHGVVRLTRIDYSGNIIWAKKYDAGDSTSIHLFKLAKTSDNFILATGYLGPDNNSVVSQRFAMKLDSSGNVLWAKEYASSISYNENTIVPLSDTDYVFSMGAFSGGAPVLCRIDSAGNVMSASKFNLTLSSINNIILHNNSLDIVLSTFYVLNTNLLGSAINWQRQYDNTQQFSSLLSNRCSNGDLIFMAGQISGGFGDGTSRVFKTDGAGNLKWAKNISAWQGPVSSASTNFDVVTHIAIKETVNGTLLVFHRTREAPCCSQYSILQATFCTIKTGLLSGNGIT